MVQSRNTKQKEIINNEINKLKGFFTSEELFKKVRNIDKNIGIATIYRYLKEEKRKNNLNMYFCNRKKLYSKEKSNHSHYICNKTGKITHFEINDLNFLSEIKDKIPGTITSIQLEIRGDSYEKY